MLTERACARDKCDTHQVGSLAGLTHRVGQLVEAFDELDGICKEMASRTRDVVDGDVVKAEGIACYTPDGTPMLRVPTCALLARAPGLITPHPPVCRLCAGKELFNNLSFEVQPGRGIIIMGPSGSGKSSLLRVLAGLWPVELGTVTRPLRSTFFVPQRPYITEGTLRDQVSHRLCWSGGS